MLLKILGSVMIIGASAFVGYIFANDCSRRPQELRDIQTMLKMFENEINFLSNVLSEAFYKIYKSSTSKTAFFFKSTIEHLRKDENISAAEAWEKSVFQHIDSTALNHEDKEILISFGRMLGSSDCQGQINNIEMALHQLRLQEQKAEEYREKYETMYRSLGVLAGIALVIVLI